MQTSVLNYRIVVEPDVQTETGKPGFTALCPTLGVADDGDTVEEALKNVQGAIEAHVDGLINIGRPIPVDDTDNDFITSTKIEVNGPIQFA